MNIEAMKLALRRAFNLGQTYWQQADSEYSSHWKKADVIKASFEQLVEETCQAIEQAQKQEPVAWMTPGGHVHFEAWLESIPLYTAPPQRQWVGLTDEEILSIMHYSQLDNARAIEAKLKEKYER